MTDQKEQGRAAGGNAPNDAGTGNQAAPTPEPSDAAAHAGSKPSAAGGEEHPVDQKVQEESGKERAANRGYD